MARWIVISAVLLAIAFVPMSYQEAGLRVGSKKFTESVILGELLKQLAGRTNKVTHSQELGGTQIVFQALVNGDVDVYPEYTGTIQEEILAGSPIEDEAAMRSVLRKRGILMSGPLGFNNTYAVGMNRETADRHKIKTISDLAGHPDLRLGFSNEFMDRADGWRSLRRHYGLVHENVTGLDHDLAYRQLNLGSIDAVDVYTTDAKIDHYDLVVLEDDRNFFPRYDAVLLFRAELKKRHPDVVTKLLQLESNISGSEMAQMNRRTEIEGESEARVAADFLKRKLGLVAEIEEQTAASRVWKHTLEHLDLVRKSLIPAILVAIPLGICAAKLPRFGQLILASVGIVQTIPALALLVVLMPPVARLGLSSIGLGSVTAILALFLYSLLPVVRNTHEGLRSISIQHQESAIALGLSAPFRLSHIELPLASQSILAGIKTAAVINVGFATLGALIGAGGYGQPIITGLRLNNSALIMQGAVPAAAMALLVQGGFELSERYFVPKGLRIKAESG